MGQLREWLWSGYRCGSVTGVAVEVMRYRLYIVGVRMVRWDKWDTVKQGILFFSVENNIQLL